MNVSLSAVDPLVCALRVAKFLNDCEGRQIEDPTPTPSDDGTGWSIDVDIERDGVPLSVRLSYFEEIESVVGWTTYIDLEVKDADRQSSKRVLYSAVNSMGHVEPMTAPMFPGTPGFSEDLQALIVLDRIATSICRRADQ